MASPVVDGLTAKQEAAIAALISEPSVAAAAKACDVGVRTLHSWLDDPAFMAAYRKARRETFAQAIAMAQRYTPVALNTLGKIMTDPGVQAAARVSAATAVLKFARESIELDELAERLEALEAQIGQNGQKGPKSWAA